MPIPTLEDRIRTSPRRSGDGIARGGVPAGIPLPEAAPGLGVICVIAIGVAAVSLLLPFAPVYDSWAWLIWGREVGELALDTTGGPSWKPLPVLFTTVFAPAGDAAPELWLAIARAGWLATGLLAWRLASRLAGPGRWGLAAGVLAAAATILLLDPFTAWLRQFAGGLAEPAAAALVLLAVDRWLSERHGQALTALGAAALIRPEAWPFLLLYGIWLWRRRAVPAPALAIVAAAVPLLWLAPDLLGSGSALTGAERARSGTESAPTEALDAVSRGLGLPLAAFWVASVWAAIGGPGIGTAPPGRGGRARAAVRLLVVGELAWVGLVGVMAALGYAGLPRFAAPAGAVACVTGAVGLVWLVRGAISSSAGRLPALAAGVLAAAALVQGAWRAGELPGDAREASRFGDQVSDLFALVDAAGSERLKACGAVSTTDLLTQPALAWRLDLPLADVSVAESSAPSSGVIFVGPGTDRAIRARIASRGEPVGDRGSQSAYSISCPASASVPTRRPIAGVTGAAR